MRRCLTCNRTFEDATLTFCIDDGTPLTGGSNEPARTDSVPAAPAAASAPVKAKRDAPAAPVYGGLGGKETWNPSQDQLAEIQNYVATTTTTTAKPRKVWPWIVLALAMLILVGGVLLIAFVRGR